MYSSSVINCFGAKIVHNAHMLSLQQCFVHQDHKSLVRQDGEFSSFAEAEAEPSLLYDSEINKPININRMSNRAPTLPQPPQTRLFRNKRADKGGRER